VKTDNFLLEEKKKNNKMNNQRINSIFASHIAQADSSAYKRAAILLMLH